MNKVSRLLSLVMIIVVMFNLCGCFDPSNIAKKHDNRKTVNEDVYSPVEEIKFNLTYLSNDSLDPFLATSEINRNLTSLIYDSLYSVDNSFKPIPQIAESSVLNGSNLLVTIKSGLTFSDGSFVTVSDIAYSFDKAKESDRYKNDLTLFDSAEVAGTHDISFTMNRTVLDAESLLTFPIIKYEVTESDPETTVANNTYGYTYGYSSNEAEEKSSTFNAPTGSGRYYLAQDENNVFYLCCNAQRLGGYFPKYRNIGLVATVDDEQIRSMYSLGRTNVIFDTYSNGEYKQIIGSSSKITLPNFVYLVCNKSSTVLQDPVVKQAINYALDRKEICDYSFVGNATPTLLPFPSAYYKTKDIKSEDKNYNDAIKLLESNGYDKINTVYNFRYNSEDTSKVLEFRLAVCSSNKFKISAAEKIKEQLAKVNIRIDIYKYGESDFFNVVSSGGYDFYLGECKMKNNLDLFGFFTAGNDLSYGIDTSGNIATAYASYQSGETDINAFINAFTEDYPFIPILYRNGNVFSNSLMAVENITIPTDYYNNIDKWKTSND